jgi:hypothetical protein
MMLGDFTIDVSGVARSEHVRHVQVLREESELKGHIHADIGLERFVKNKYYHI